MRHLKHIKVPYAKRRYLTVFGGYHHRSIIDAGECFDMENLTSDDYPLLSVRKARSAYENIGGSSMQDCVALHGRSDFPVVCNAYGDILCGGHALNGLLRTENGTIPPNLLPKKLVSMGAWCIIFPDKVWFNAVRLGNGDAMTAGQDYGSLDNETRALCGNPGYSGADCVHFTTVFCSGTDYQPYSEGAVRYGKTPPASPENGDFWCETGGAQAQMKVYDEASESWLPVISSYIRITAEDTNGVVRPIGSGFSAGDGITISDLVGFNVEVEDQNDPVRTYVQNLNGAHIVCACTENSIVIEGCIGIGSVSCHNAKSDGDIVFSRSVPELDFVVECGNRLWGCRYGLTGGKRINEIYASKLGDFKNWRCYSGISTDSYAASRGAEGEFTGAAVLGGNPLFFRETSFEKVYPDANGAHKIVTVTAPGIQRGSWRSAVCVGSVLYYKGRDGIYAYTGSLPQCISYPLGDALYTDAAAGSFGTKYYISMLDADGTPQLFVFDTVRRLWHREDSTRFTFAAEHEGALYFGGGCDPALKVGGIDVSTNVRWMAESGIIGLISPDQKRISRLLLRLQPELGAEIRLLVQYDSDGCWHEKLRLHGSSLHSVTAPIVPIRCDHMRLRLEGIGGMKLYSVAWQTEEGSDLP